MGPFVRGTALVMSRSSAFVEIVGGMLVDAGFEVATAIPAEPAWRAVTRTEPALVICDANSPQDMVERVISETIVRRLPLLMLGVSASRTSARAARFPNAGIVWLELPLARDAFRSAIDELLMPPPSIGRAVALSAGGVTVEAGFVARSLDQSARDR